MIIDSHCHVAEFQHFGEALVCLMSTGRRPPWWAPDQEWRREFLATDIPRFLSHLDEFQIDLAIIFGLSIKPYGMHVPLEYVAGLVEKYSDRFIGFHSVDPVGGLEAAKESERAVKDYGLKGIKLQPAANNVAIDDPRGLPIYEKAAELGVPVVLHTGWTRVPPVRFDGQRATAIDEVATRFPRLVIILAHCGWPWLEDAVAVLHRHPNVYGDISDLVTLLPTDHLARFLVWAKHLNIFDKLFWGSDYPFFSPRRDMDACRNLVEYTKAKALEPAITEDDIAKLLGLSVAKALRL